MYQYIYLYIYIYIKNKRARGRSMTPPHRIRAHSLCGSGRPMSSRIYFTNLSKEDNVIVVSSIVAEASAT